MFQRLSMRWESIIALSAAQQQTTNGELKKNGVGGNDNDLCVLEVCEDILARLLTRDYSDFIKVLIFTAPQHVLNQQQQMAGGDELWVFFSSSPEFIDGPVAREQKRERVRE